MLRVLLFLSALLLACGEARDREPTRPLVLGAGDFFSRGIQVGAGHPGGEGSLIHLDTARDALALWPQPRPGETTTLRVPVEQGPQRLSGTFFLNPRFPASVQARIALEIPGRADQPLFAETLAAGEPLHFDARYEVDGRGAEIVVTVSLAPGSRSYAYSRVELRDLVLEVRPHGRIIAE